jgi:F-type H+-transporting ATPase subunit b
MSCSFLFRAAPRRRRLGLRALSCAVVVAALIAAGAVTAAAQPAPEHAGQAAGSHAAGAANPAEAGSAHAPAEGGAAQPSSPAHGEEAAHGESVWSFLSRIANFLILAWGLWYLFRTPFGSYLQARAEQIRGGLTSAAALRADASARLAEIETRMKALPGEIEALKKRRADEIAAEEARIREAAEAERVRLVENARREIDLQLQAARRGLTQYAGDLAVDLAEQRIKAQITGADQQRLINRYVTQMRAVNE